MGSRSQKLVLLAADWGPGAWGVLEIVRDFCRFLCFMGQLCVILGTSALQMSS